MASHTAPLASPASGRAHSEHAALATSPVVAAHGSASRTRRDHARRAARSRPQPTRVARPAAGAANRSMRLPVVSPSRAAWVPQVRRGDEGVESPWGHLRDQHRGDTAAGGGSRVRTRGAEVGGNGPAVGRQEAGCTRCATRSSNSREGGDANARRPPAPQGPPERPGRHHHRHAARGGPDRPPSRGTSSSR